jgi:hypothetical protein
VAISSDRNVVNKEAEKELNHKNLSTEILKCLVIPVVIGSTGTVTKGLKKISGNNTRKAFHTFSAKNSCTGNITYNEESATV